MTRLVSGPYPFLLMSRMTPFLQQGSSEQILSTRSESGLLSRCGHNILVEE